MCDVCASAHIYVCEMCEVCVMSDVCCSCDVCDVHLVGAHV